MRALVVDDDQMICKCITEKICWEELGCICPRIAYDGQMALKIMHEEKIDIVITDVKMPVMDGIELCRTLYEKFCNVPVILVSAYDDFTTAQMALRWNVKGYLLKPMNSKSLLELEQLIKEALHQRNAKSVYTEITSDRYRDFLMQVLQEKNINALEILLNRIREVIRYEKIGSEIWTYLLSPLFDFKAQRNISPSVLFYEERQLKERLLSGEMIKGLEILHKCYLDEMKDVDEITNDAAIISQIQEYIKQHFSLPELNVSLLGNEFYMSAAYLGRFFYEHTGVKLLDYIVQIRLQHACEQLLHTRKYIGTIAMEVGYPDSNYFAKVFYKNINMTPVEYRKRKGVVLK